MRITHYSIINIYDSRRKVLPKTPESEGNSVRKGKEIPAKQVKKARKTPKKGGEKGKASKTAIYTKARTKSRQRIQLVHKKKRRVQVRSRKR